jgi:hypothetical protein
MATTATPKGATGESRRRVVVRRTVITLIVLACIWGLVIAAQHTVTGDSSVTQSGPGSVATILSPLDGDPVVNQQAQISLALDLRYDTTLSVEAPNGRTVARIPPDQITKLPQQGSNELLFTPGPGKILASLPQGQVCVRADPFRIDGTPEAVRPVHWCFRVT